MAIITNELKGGGKSHTVVFRANGKQVWKRFDTKREASASPAALTEN